LRHPVSLGVEDAHADLVAKVVKTAHELIEESPASPAQRWHVLEQHPARLKALNSAQEGQHKAVPWVVNAARPGC
jgi:hypothetical protein